MSERDRLAEGLLTLTPTEAAYAIADLLIILDEQDGESLRYRRIIDKLVAESDWPNRFVDMHNT